MDAEKVKALMRRCRAGVGGSDALEDAHDIMAECYGKLGALGMEVTALRRAIAEHNEKMKAACLERDCALITAAGCVDCPRKHEIGVPE